MNAKFIKFFSSLPLGPLGVGLRGYWKFNETTGNILYDSNIQYPGYRMGDTTLGVPGKIGTAVSFDGSGDYIDLGSAVADVGTNDFTVCGWIYLNNSVNTYNGICGNFGSYPHFYVTVGDGFNDYIRAVLAINFSTTITITSDGGINTGTWYHIAVVFDRDSTMRLYINASLQMDAKSIAGYSGTNIVNPNTFNIGNIGSAMNGYFGNLRADCWGLWLKALSAGEISQLYNSGSGFDFPFI